MSVPESAGVHRLHWIRVLLVGSDPPLLPLRVLMVYEGSEADPIRSLRPLPKWGAFDEIVSEVEYLYDGGQPQAEASPDALA